MPRRVGPYGKLLANYAQDDAIIAAGLDAELLFTRAIAFCSTSDSDGYITDGQLTRVVGAGMRDAPKRATALVREGLWERTEDGYQIRSWLKIHDATEEKGRKLRTDRVRKQRERKSAVRSESEPRPSGQDAESEGIPEDVTQDSLDCTYVSSPTGSPVQSNQVQSKVLAAVAPSESIGQRANRLTKNYTDRVKLSNFPAIAGIVRKAIGANYPDDAIADALIRLASEGRSVTAEILRVEMDGQPPRRQPQRGTTDQRVMDHLALADRLSKEAQA